MKVVALDSCSFVSRTFHLLHARPHRQPLQSREVESFIQVGGAPSSRNEEMVDGVDIFSWIVDSCTGDW